MATGVKIKLPLLPCVQNVLVRNKVIKEDGGGVGLFDNSNATLTAPHIAQLLDDAVVNDDENHHEDNDRFEIPLRL